MGQVTRNLCRSHYIPQLVPGRSRVFLQLFIKMPIGVVPASIPSYALFCTLCVVLNSRCSSQGVDIFAIIGIPKNSKFYALSFISIVKLRIVKQKAQRIAKNHILEIELSNAKLTAQSSGIFWGVRFTKSESPTINEYYDQFSSQLIKAII